MDNRQIALAKADRVYRMIQKFDELKPQELKSILNNMMQIIELYPVKDNAKNELYGRLRYLSGMDINKYGVVFKASNWKFSKLIKRQDIVSLFRNTVSVMK